MLKILKYDLNSTYESNKDSLNQLDNYVALTEDNQTIHLKPPFKGLIINTNNTGTTINKRTDKQYGEEEVTLENGKNTFTDWNYGFYFDTIIMKQNQITSFDLSKYDTSNVTNMSKMFSYCTSLTSLDVSNFDTSKVTDMGGMFQDCTNLTSLDLSSFNTSNVTTMDSMFSSCRDLTSLDVSSFDTTNVTSMMQMFYGCSGLTTLDVSKFNTSNVNSMYGMFQSCSGLTSLDLSNFVTTNVTNMYSMFSGCTNLTSLDVSNFDTSKITRKNDMFYMFINCNKLTHIKCKQAFKEWCITNQANIYLPTAMRNNGDGQWEIIDA